MNKYEHLLRCRIRHHQGCPALDVLDAVDAMDELKVASIKSDEPTTGRTDHGPATSPRNPNFPPVRGTCLTLGVPSTIDQGSILLRSASVR